MQAGCFSPNHRSQRGFSLIEMMVVVAVVGVLASAAIPQYRRSIYKTRRAEAYFGLRSIHDHQLAYHAANNLEYTDSFRRLGTPLEGGKLRDDGAYRDRAENGSIFVAKTSMQWLELGPEERRAAAEKIRIRLIEDNVEEILIFDQGHLLQAHYKNGDWRVTRAWTP